MGFHQSGPGEPLSDGEGELRRRLAFYEDFDAIINENVRRSGELLREAERRHVEAAAARDSQRDLLRALAGEAAALACQAEALSRRIESALAGLDTRPPQPPGAVERAAAPALISDIAIHGVPDVVRAAGLRDAFAAAPGVDRVDVMEFSTGLLRLRVHPGIAHPFELLRSAVIESGLEEIASGPGVVSVRLNQESR